MRALIAALAILLVASAARAEVHVVTSNGRVTIRADQATPREILSEWARVGHITVVNLDWVRGGPLMLEINDMPERDALDIVLRAAGGYVAAPRPVLAAGLSQFDRIFVMRIAEARVASGSVAASGSVPAQPVAAVATTGAGAPPVVDRLPAPPVANAAPAAAASQAAAAGVTRDSRQNASPAYFNGVALNGAPASAVAPPVASPSLPAPANSMPTSATSSTSAGARVPGVTPGTASFVGGVSAPGLMTTPVQPPPPNSATWQPGMPTFRPPVPPGVPTAQPGQVGAPQYPSTQSGQTSSGSGAASRP